MPRNHPRQPKHHTASSSRPSKSQRLDVMARKKDERAARKKERKASSNVLTADDKSFASQLAEMGLKVREVIGDGNCLFRALADQLDGDDHAHSRHRQDVVRYITEHRDDFEPFIEDDVPFTQHVQNLAQDGTYGGNDSIVAFARLHKLTVVIHQLDSPAWEVHGETAGGTTSSKALVRQLHISYHNGDHYASVRSIHDNSDSPANVHMTPQAPATATSQSAGNKHAQLTELSSGAADATAGECVATTTTTTTTYEDLKFIERVIEVTHCRDRRLVAEVCAEAGYFDLDAVCGHVLAFMDGVRSSSSSTTSDGELAADAAPHVVTSASLATAAASSAKPKSRATRRQRKQEKKARAAQRHQANAAAASNSVVMTAAAAGSVGGCHGSGCHGRWGSCSDEDDASPFVISQQLKVLQI